MRKIIIKLLNSYQFAQLRFLFQKFSYKGFFLSYLAHRYNATWRNERALEVSLIWEIVSIYKNTFGKNVKILELGNVLSHYFDISHEVIDKYEKSEGVLNADIIDFFPQKKYDLILGVSTLEHVGWDEAQKSPLKTMRAIKRMQQILKPGGLLVLTFPHGHNLFLDFFIKYNLFKFQDLTFYQRVSFLNRWEKVSKKTFLSTSYGKPYGNANGVCIAVFKKKRDIL